MQSRNFGEVFKNVAGSVFLLAAAFFVCSTLVSMRAVLADPVRPQQIVTAGAAPQASRAGVATAQRATRANTASGNSARTGGAVASAPRTVAGRSNASRAQAAQTNSARNVAQRSNNAGVARGGVANRAVVARVGMGQTAGTAARISLTGTAIRGSSAVTNTSLQGKLYTGNYSNIVDSTTGLISAEAYSNCLDSYYTCMDEICTARNAAQRRCACAGRVKAFADAESKLESANEELIKVSGELALLIASKGKDISDAFKLTDAEKVMNCVSWQDANKQDKWTTGADSEAYKWCTSHGIYSGAETCGKPDYCKAGGNSFGFDVKDLNGNGSDILASLQSWAAAKDKTLTITQSDNAALIGNFTNLVNVVGGLTNSLESNATIKDSLAETWGYELFEYAHNNVCNRVLDSCFNGIYEACGQPKEQKCSNGSSTCPYNYNSTISVDAKNGEYTLNFITSGNNGYSNSNTASCFGYSSTTTTSARGYTSASTSDDPYSDLRGPVADARRSILQKYALDANADCDAYGDQLKTTAQNIGYQKIAAQQALQSKRLEFSRNAAAQILNDAMTARTNFNECLSEIYDCYNTQVSSNPSWSTSRIKTYCAQTVNVPHCYEQMICAPSGEQYNMVIDTLDNANCVWTQNPAGISSSSSDTRCRNVVTFSEIVKAITTTSPENWPAEGEKANSAELREMCLKNAIGTGETVRNWQKPVSCPANSTENQFCSVISPDGTVGGCSQIGCKCNPNHKTSGGTCVSA